MNLELDESGKGLQYQAERYGELTAKLGRGIKPLAEYFTFVGAFFALGSIFDLIASESEFGRGMVATIGLVAFLAGGIEWLEKRRLDSELARIRKVFSDRGYWISASHNGEASVLKNAKLKILDTAFHSPLTPPR